MSEIELLTKKRIFTPNKDVFILFLVYLKEKKSFFKAAYHNVLILRKIIIKKLGLKIIKV